MALSLYRKSPDPSGKRPIDWKLESEESASKKTYLDLSAWVLLVFPFFIYNFLLNYFIPSLFHTGFLLMCVNGLNLTSAAEFQSDDEFQSGDMLRSTEFSEWNG